VIILGVDIGTRRLGLALLDADTEKLRAHYAVELPRDPVNRLAAAYDQAQLVAAPTVVVVPEQPSGRYVHASLLEVLGAFKAGCTHAAWVHPGLPPSQWKRDSVGRGTASKPEYVAWAQHAYHVQTTDDDICAAIGIAHAGRLWWNSQRKEGAA
jgi:Holliday junction resolvasome RuvABC endonuclease subunit